MAAATPASAEAEIINSSDESEATEGAGLRARGRPKDPVHKHFRAVRPKKPGEVADVPAPKKKLWCFHCWNPVSKRARDLRKHVLTDCNTIPSEQRDEYRIGFIAKAGPVKAAHAAVPTATRRDSRQADLVGDSFVAKGRVGDALAAVWDRKLLLLVVMCGLSFHMVDSPWFIDYARSLSPNYVPAGRCLAQHIAPSSSPGAWQLAAD